MNINGLSVSKSKHSFETTYNTLKNTLETNPNIKIIAEIDHHKNANSVNISINPTRVLIFGNPNLGTPLMQKNQLVGLDLPQKIVVYQTENKEVYVAFNSVKYVKERHVLEDIDALSKINKALITITTKATENEIIENLSEGFNTSIITKKSNQTFNDTYHTLKMIIDNNPNLKIIKEINHQENASSAGLSLSATRLLIFGNPKLGSPLMKESQTIAIDLPQKIIVWENNGVVNISYNNPEFLKKRHHINSNNTIIATITNALDALSNKSMVAK